MRSVVDRLCTEYTGTVSEIQAQEVDGVDQGGTWSSNECPAPSDEPMAGVDGPSAH